MTPYLQDSDVTLHQGDSLEVLRSMPDASVHMACTSPPFFGLRDYGTGTWAGGDEGCDHIKQDPVRSGSSTLGTPADGGHNRIGEANATVVHKQVFRDTCGKCGARRIDSQIGLESSPDEWAARLVDVFREVRRVLRDDGTLWVECGDSYAAQGGGKTEGQYEEKRVPGATYQFPRTPPSGLKPKDLIGSPWLLAFALRADGWYLRSCIIWSKPNAMPESVTDRPTTGHSYVFLFSKRPRYFYDAEALREPHATPLHAPGNTKTFAKNGTNSWEPDRMEEVWGNPAGKNARTVWTIPTEPNALAICRVCDAYWQGGAPREHCGEPVVQHFAAFPRELVRRMILAGTSERGVCGECGAPWVREVERETMLIDRSERTHSMGQTRSSGTMTRPPSSKTLGWHSSCECVLSELEHDFTVGASPASDWQTTSDLESDRASSSESACIPATVLDPFSGSGTTLLVARSLGRHAVGIELNERYCAMTRARMSQLSLLSELA